MSLKLFPIVCALAVAACAQTSSTKDNLYSRALEASVIEMEKQWGHLGHSALDDEVQIPTNYRRMIVHKNPIITDDLPTAFGNHSIEYLSDQEVIERSKKVKKAFAVLKIGPIRNEGAVLKVVVSVYWFSYKNHRAQFAYSDWSDVRFHYDCERDTFFMASVKLGGI
jgi:hypothetical protein